MSDHNALERGILADPEDDPRRLIYADWLEEHGGKERAEFIRLQCEIDRMPAHSPERIDREGRIEDLFKQFAEAWELLPPKWARAHYQWDLLKQFRKGFLHCIHARPNSFRRYAPALFVRAPVREAQVGVIRDGGRSVAKSEALGQLRALRLTFIDMPMDVPLFLSSPHLPPLTELSVRFTGPNEDGLYTSAPMLTDADAATIAYCPQLAWLTLDLSNHHLGPDAVRALFGTGNLAMVERLDLSGNPIGDVGVRRLCESGRLGQLVELDLRGAQVGESGYKALVAAHPGRLKKLAIGQYNEPMPTGAINILARCESLAALEELDISWKPLTVAEVRELAGSPHLGALRVLHLGGTQFNDAMALELAKSPYLRDLHFLDLQHNQLTSRGAIALARSPILAQVTDLVLYNNPGIGDDGAEALATSEYASALRFVCLVTTGMGTRGAEAIARSPHFARIRRLQLEDNPIGTAGAEAILQSPYLQHVRDLTVGTGKLGPELLRALRSRFGSALVG